MPLVSIIVPVYNVEKYITKCLESVKAQSLTDFECLIIDDASPDNSIEVAKKVIKDDKRFKIYHKPNGGLSDARNFGIDKAIGEYLFFLDSDDYISEDLLSLSYEMAKRHDSDIVCFDMMYVYDDGSQSVSSGADFDICNYESNKELIFINNSANNKIYRQSFLAKRRFIKDMWYEDLAVIPTWLAMANNVSHVAKPLYFYLQRSGSISHSADERIFDIYKSISTIKETLNLSSKDVARLYFDNCLIMTTLRIRAIEDDQKRKDFYRKHIELLDYHYPDWYNDMKNMHYSIKRKIVFYLLKHRMINLLDRVY